MLRYRSDASHADDHRAHPDHRGARHTSRERSADERSRPASTRDDRDRGLRARCRGVAAGRSHIAAIGCGVRHTDGMSIATRAAAWAAVTGWILTTLAAVPRARAEDAVYQGQIRECRIGLEYSARDAYVRVRAQSSTNAPCDLSREETEALVRRGLAGLPRGVAIRSLGLGRIIDFRWISAHLARTAASDAEWSSAAGAPTDGDTYAYVRRVLEAPAVTESFNRALADRGLAVGGADVEKVLVSSDERATPSWVPPIGRLPFDALTTFDLNPLESREETTR
jgi:hypothetical protein